MKSLVFLLEEPSAIELLKGILPRILPDNVEAFYLVFEGKQDLDKRMEARIRGWRRPDTGFIVIRDKDGGDCVAIKQSLRKKATRSGREDTLIRIACHEMESFFLGDLAAVEAAIGPPGLSSNQTRKKFRQPDRIANPAEELGRLTRYQKVAGSRAISPHLRLDRSNRSHSFNVLIEGIRRVILQC